MPTTVELGFMSDQFLTTQLNYPSVYRKDFPEGNLAFSGNGVRSQTLSALWLGRCDGVQGCPFYHVTSQGNAREEIFSFDDQHDLKTH